MTMSDDHFEKVGPAAAERGGTEDAESPKGDWAVDAIHSSDTARGLALGAYAAGTAGLGQELAKMCGKAGAAGAVVDGAVGGMRAAKHVRQGTIDTRQAAKHVGAEAGCGFVTSSSGTAGTIAVFMITGSMGPFALAAGMGASMGSRYVYKQIVGETLPNEEDLEEMRRQTNRAASQRDMSDIGPGAEPDMEDIGPDSEAEAPDPEDVSVASDDEGSDHDKSSHFTDVGSDETDEGDDDGESDGTPWENIGPDA